MINFYDLLYNVKYQRCNHIHMVFLRLLSECLMAIFLALPLSGCALFTPVKVDTNKYYLNKVPEYYSPKKKRDITLVVLYPQSAALYNTKKIAYTTKSNLIGYYTKNEWGATPAQMFYPLMVEALQKSHYFRSVVTPPYIGKDDILLKIQVLIVLQDFTHNTAKVRFVILAQMSNQENNKVISKILSVEEPMITKPPFGGIDATNRAVSKILERLALFAVDGRL